MEHSAWYGFNKKKKRGVDKDMKDLNKYIGALLASLIMAQSGSAETNRIFINISALAMVESGMNPKAYNFRSKARGIFQITPVVLKEYNKKFKLRIKNEALFDWMLNQRIAIWYLTDRIPELLLWAGLPITTERILWVWNAGISNVKKGIMPTETRNLINEYHRLERE